MQVVMKEVTRLSLGCLTKLSQVCHGLSRACHELVTSLSQACHVVITHDYCLNVHSECIQYLKDI